ncbi:unnamed protein product [Caenorhabditis bovis]|uniref:Sodium/hydrogen exchanger n=1 Tax=Caenorhabditis bovis TaxID=2654633 RepID=A0A8S1EIV8_9PELO|nr:unnamed protein product [Caenorhabditis bovis]
MEDGADWVMDAVPAEIEEAKHGLDLFHLDFSMTGGVLVLIILLLFVTLLKPTLHFPGIRFIPESIMLMVYGLLIASAIKYFGNSSEFKLTPRLFFVFLLPAIVNDAGLSMKKRSFFRLFGKICLYAVFGTISATLFTATALYFVRDFFVFQTSFLPLLVFGSLISAVDPVSVLSTFAELDVNLPLFTLIFGESMMNDAVTIVLYRTSINIIKQSDATHTMMSIASIIKNSIIQFSVVSFCGVGIGLISGLIGVYLIKKNVGNQICTPVFQLSVPFACYLFTESLHYSGIFACVSCSMLMSHYMKLNMCVEMELVVFTCSKLFSSTAEMVIFIFLGLSGISNYHEFDFWFCVYTFIFCSLIRFINVFFISYLTNLFGDEDSRLELNDQYIIFHAGIRGAVCFGLVQSIDERVIPEKLFFVTNTLFMIAVTSLFQGCTVKMFMKLLKVRGSDGAIPAMGPWMKAFRKFDIHILRPYLASENIYLETDKTFHDLGLPKAVSTALRIGERSHTDLKSLAHKQERSVARPTAAPGVEFNLDDNITYTNQLSTGRRTPSQRNSIYSRHFIQLRPSSPITVEEPFDDDNNYSTCPARIIRKRPTFNPKDAYEPLNTISGHHEHELLRPRHNSIGTDTEIDSERPREKKLSRTIVSGAKTFVIAPEELDAINEDSSSSSHH